MSCQLLLVRASLLPFAACRTLSGRLLLLRLILPLPALLPVICFYFSCANYIFLLSCLFYHIDTIQTTTINGFAVYTVCIHCLFAVFLHVLPFPAVIFSGILKGIAFCEVFFLRLLPGQLTGILSNNSRKWVFVVSCYHCEALRVLRALSLLLPFVKI